jgi:hypothetical protein
VRFASPDNFAYDSARYHFKEGEKLSFDERYRYAQLPLIAPRHPAVLINSPDGEYVSGSYANPRYSLVARVPDLDTSSLGALTTAAEKSPFGHKLDHKMTDRRRDLLHVTIAGGLERSFAGRLSNVAGALEGFGGFSMRLFGPLIGQFNTGRMYLPAVPTQGTDTDAFREIQRSLGLIPTNFFACGFLHFQEELTPSETQAVQEFLQAWSKEIVLECRVDKLWVMSTHDDLALSSNFEFAIELTEE